MLELISIAVIMETYKNFSWNPNDLLQCANTVRAMRIQGFSFEEISELNFGNLDVIDVYYEE